MIDLNIFAKQSLLIADKRHENGANIKTDTRSMLKHCATEVVEAMEAYTLMNEDFRHKGCCNNINFSSELADIVCCVFIIAGKENIDIETAILDCMEKNRKRAEGIGDKL